ncbi:hypothetical protein FRB98_008876 [Tulasnella sp. 332]|nr:hypothetical protein FRB98_008876 [Tulasnella sp. 332]
MNPFSVFLFASTTEYGVVRGVARGAAVASGLSQGGRTAVIVSIIVGVFLLISLGSYFYRRRKIQRANRAYNIAANSRGSGGRTVYDPPPPPVTGDPDAEAERSQAQVQNGSMSQQGGMGHPPQQEAPMSQIRLGFPEPSHQLETPQPSSSDPAMGATYLPTGAPIFERNQTLPPYTVEDNHV